MPKIEEIYKHWKGKLPMLRDNEWLESEERTCFACGLFHHLDRAHIIPLAQGGDNSLDNLHILCIGCHTNSEGNKYYWNWLTYMRKHEWRSRVDWITKILVMDGVNFDDEWKKHEHMAWTKEWFKQLEALLYDHGIICTPKPGCEGWFDGEDGD